MCGFVCSVMQEQPGGNGREPSVYETYFPDLLASFTGGLLADMITFPLETVLHRMYVQVWRTKTIVFIFFVCNLVGWVGLGRQTF